jgi:hypothetical protein
MAVSTGPGETTSTSTPLPARVDVHQALEDAEVRHALEPSLHRDAGVVHEHVDAAVERDGALDHVAARRPLADVGRHGDGAAAGGDAAPDRFLEPCRAARREHQVGAARRSSRRARARCRPTRR